MEKNKTRTAADIFLSAADSLRCANAVPGAIVVMLAAAAVIMGEDLSFLMHILGAMTFLLIAGTVQNFRLRRYGISRSIREKSRKSFDPRLKGSIEDIGGMSMFFGCLAAIASALSDFFIIEGAVFDGTELACPSAAAAAKALALGCCINIMASSDGLERTAYLSMARSFKGDSPLKTAAKASHYPELMKNIRGVAAARITACVGITLSVSLVSFAGTGCPLTVLGTAFICLILLVLTETFRINEKPKRSEEKVRLINKSVKRFCIVNSVFFLLITAGFMFSYHIRTVYTEYEFLTEFDYYEEEIDFEAEEPLFSVPVNNKENASLFTGFYIVCIGMVITAAYAARAEMSASSAFSVNEAAAVAICVSAAVIYVSVKGMLDPASALGPVMWLVCISFICISIIVNMLQIYINRPKTAVDAPVKRKG